MSSSVKYNILLENDTEMIENENILFNIPVIKTLIEKNKSDETISDKNILDLRSINPTTFGYIITLLKFNINNSENESEIFNNNFIKNMNVNILIDFISLTHRLELEKFKQISADRFMYIFTKNDCEGIRNELKIKNDLTEQEKYNIKKDNEWLDEKN